MNETEYSIWICANEMKWISNNINNYLPQIILWMHNFIHIFIIYFSFAPHFSLYSFSFNHFGSSYCCCFIDAYYVRRPANVYGYMCRHFHNYRLSDSNARHLHNTNIRGLFFTSSTLPFLLVFLFIDDRFLNMLTDFLIFTCSFFCFLFIFSSLDFCGVFFFNGNCMLYLEKKEE